MRLLRAILLASALVIVFIAVTTRRWPGYDLWKPIRDTGHAWTEPDRRIPRDSTRTNRTTSIYIKPRVKPRSTSPAPSTSGTGSGISIPPARWAADSSSMPTAASSPTPTCCKGAAKSRSPCRTRIAIPPRSWARDTHNDLGLIQINPKRKLTVLRLGDSDNFQVGQKVLAIGNPFGLNGTLTTGVVSSLGRDIQASATISSRT